MVNLFKMKRLHIITFVFSALLWQTATAQEVDPFAHMPAPAFPGQTNAPPPQLHSSFKLRKLMDGLTAPRSLAVLPDDEGILVTEGNGTVRIIRPDGSISDPISGMPAIRSVAGRSMNDFILDTNFSVTRRVFLTYSAPPDDEPGGPKTAADREAWSKQPESVRQNKPFQVGRVASARLSEDDSRLEDVRVIYNVLGRRLVSTRDGKLFITTWGYGEQRPLVQKLDNTVGKVLRINVDGSIPADNPFVSRDGIVPAIYSYGHRDPDGAFINPQTGRLWTIEHGPMGGDEINIIQAGGNYGWPEVTYGRNYDGTSITDLTQRAGTIQPIYYWYPSVAPSGLLLYTGEMFPEWQGNIFAGTMSATQGKFLVRLVMDGDKVIAEEHLLANRDRRVRFVTQGNDGALYVLTDSEDNDKTNRHFKGEVLKLTSVR